MECLKIESKILIVFVISAICGFGAPTINLASASEEAEYDDSNIVGIEFPSGQLHISKTLQGAPAIVMASVLERGLIGPIAITVKNTGRRIWAKGSYALLFSSPAFPMHASPTSPPVTKMALLRDVPCQETYIFVCFVKAP